MAKHAGSSHCVHISPLIHITSRTPVEMNVIHLNNRIGLDFVGHVCKEREVTDVCVQ